MWRQQGEGRCCGGSRVRGNAGAAGWGRCRCSRVRGDAGTAGTLTPVSLWEAQSQVLDPHWVESRGLYLDTMHLGPQGWDPQGR